MENKNLKNRNEIEEKYKWNIEKMYSSKALWEEDIKKAENLSKEFLKFQGNLTDSSKTLHEALEIRDKIWQIVEKAFVYSRMKQDEDNRISESQAMVDKSETTIAKISAFMSFFTPELLSSEEGTIEKFMSENPDLKKYEFLLETILREKKHVLSTEGENILAQLSEVTHAPHSIFNMLNNADMNFGEIEGEAGKKVQLTHGNYITFMESPNREVRKRAYERIYETYRNLVNTLATSYSFNVKGDAVSARIRNYPSSRAAALSSGNISEEVYDNLIDVVNSYLPVLHKYTELRKSILGVENLKMYDVYVPLVEIPKKEISFEEAVQLMKEALAPLGEEYIANVENGVKNRWIDVHETHGKTSGAYSFGSYDSMPYILLNFTHSLKDVFTLVHEMGHSMHSYYTRKTQPFIYGDHSIFTAEVASTVNESLLINYLLNKETDKEMRKYLINFYIEEFRTTLFRQTMFAEFEKLTHEAVENGKSLTNEFLCREYNKLNQKYFGNTIEDDEFIKYEWSRIPHFYRSFYVYQYATGFSAATSLSNKILTEGDVARNNYIEFLTLGSSKDPVDLLKIAGVDMSSPEPVNEAMETFKALVLELEKLS